MRIVHVAPRLSSPAAELAPAVLALARAQARANSGRVQIVAAAPEAQSTRLHELEVRLFPGSPPRGLGRSRALRHHLANCPLELIHAHCPGQRGLHYAHLAAQRHGAPLVISPAGVFGLGPGERLRPRSAFHRFVIHPQAFENAAGWHATSAEEAAALHACGFHQPVCIAPPGVEIPSATVLDATRRWWQQRHPVLRQRPVALCTDPLEPRSRLRALITLWAEAFTADWLLLLAGPPGRESAAALREHARRRGAADRVLIVEPGEAPPHAAARLYLSARHAHSALDPVAAALAAGLPALVTDDTPWSRLDADQAGWCVAWREFGPALRRALALGPEGLAQRGVGARDLARREFDWAHTAENLLGFYRHLRV